MVLKNNVIAIIYGDGCLEDAVFINDTISDNEDFYREFLSEYDSIVLGKKDVSDKCLCLEHLKKDSVCNSFNSLILKKYNLDWFVGGFLDCLLKESSFVYDISDWNTRLYSLSSLDDLDIIRYCFSSKRFDLLKKYFESDSENKISNIHSIMRSMNDEYRYIWLNNILGSYSSFIIDNCDEFLEYVLKLQKSFLERVDIESLESKFYMSKDDTLLLVRDILRDIDTSCELVNLFDDALKNGHFIIYKDAEREGLRQNISTFFKDAFDKHENVVVKFDNSIMGFCCLKEDISDVFSIIHEFMHYYEDICFMEKNGVYNGSFSYFNELSSRFFEKYVANCLVKRGYDLDKAYIPYHKHVCHDINNALSIAIIMNFLSVLKKQGRVDANNINSNLSFWEILNNYKRLGYYEANSWFINLYAKQDIDSKNGWCDLGLLLKKDEQGLADSHLSYFIGSYFSWNLELNKENVSMILDMIKNKTSDSGILNSLKNKVKEQGKVKVKCSSSSSEV